MTEEEVKQGLIDISHLAKDMSVTIALNLLMQELSIYHSKRDDQSLIRMNYYMQILLLKQRLISIESSLRDCTFVLRQRELLETIKQIKS